MAPTQFVKNTNAHNAEITYFKITFTEHGDDSK